MKRFAYSAYCAGIAFFCGSALALWLGITSLLTVHVIHYSFDALVHQATQDSIITSIDAMAQGKLFSSSLPSKLYERYPFLQEVSSRFSLPGALKIISKTSAPLYTINHNMVLLENRKIVPRETLALDEIDDLECVMIPELSGDELSSDLFIFLKTCPLELFDRYSITIFDETDIQLIDKELPQFIIRADHHSVTLDMLERCKGIEQDLKQKNSFARNAQWIVDVRFQDQIIIRKLNVKGGA